MNKIEEINYILSLNNRFEAHKPALIKNYQQFRPDWDPNWIRDRIEKSYANFSLPIFETIQYIETEKQKRINLTKSELEKIKIEGMFQENFHHLYEDYQAYILRRTKALYQTTQQLLLFLKQKALITNETYDTFQEKQQLNFWIESLFFQTRSNRCSREAHYEYQYLQNTSYLESFLPNQLDNNKKELRQHFYHTYLKEYHLNPKESTKELATQLTMYKRKLRQEFLEATIKPTLDFQTFCSGFMSKEKQNQPLDINLYDFFLGTVPAIIFGTTVETNEIAGIINYPVLTQRNLEVHIDAQKQLYHELDHLLHVHQTKDGIITGLTYIKENQLRNRMVNEIQTEKNATQTVQFFRDHQMDFYIPQIPHFKRKREQDSGYTQTYYLSKPFFDNYQDELKRLAHNGNGQQMEKIFGKQEFQTFSTMLDNIETKLKTEQITTDQLPNINTTKQELNQLMSQLNKNYDTYQKNNSTKVKTLHR